jgi:hypothetical protein
MNNRIEIRDERSTLIAYKIGNDLQEGLCPYSDDSNFIQVLSWNHQEGKRLNRHTHLEVPRTATRTQEAIVVLSGHVRTDVYDEERKLIGQILLGPGECMVFLEGGHGFEILEDGTRVFEIKNGPYPGAEADRERF